MTDIIFGSAGTEEEVIQQLTKIRFRMYQGNKTQTSISLGISVRTLDARLEKYADDESRENERREAARVRDAATLERMRGSNQNVLGFESGVRMESPIELPSQQVVPMPERPEIQEMLPRPSSKSGSKRRG